MTVRRNRTGDPASEFAPEWKRGYNSNRRTGKPRTMTLEEARKLLGLGQHASRHEIRSAYRQEARRWHPDRALDPEPRSRIPPTHAAG